MVTPTNAQKMIQHFQEYFTIYEAVLPYLGSETNKKLIIEQKRDWMRKLRQTEFPVAFLGSYSGFFGLCYAMDGGYKGWNPYIERHLAIFVNCFQSRTS